jgi:branched-chain amino acid transport system ATP-binding protein
MLELHNVSASWYKDRTIGGYDDTRVVSFAASPGEWVVIAGENGIGKSTLLHAIAGTANFVSGEILLDGVPLRPRSLMSRFVSGVQIVPQHPSLRGELITQDAQDLALLKRPGLNNQWAIADLMNRLRAQSIILGDDLFPRIFDLVASLLSVPRVWILDEIIPALPTSSQNLESYRALKELVPLTTVIFVDHDVNRALEIADHVLWLKENEHPAFFPVEDSAAVKELQSNLGAVRAKDSTDVGDKDFLIRVLSLDRSPRSQVKLAFQAGRKGKVPFNEQEIYDDFPFLNSDHPSETLSGGQRIVLLWVILEVGKVGKLPNQLSGHLDQHISGKLRQRSREMKESSNA